MSLDTRALPRLQRWAFNGLVVAEHVVGRERAELVMGAPGLRLQRSIARSLQDHGPARAVPVPEEEGLDRSTFHRRYERALQPVVFRGLAAHWEAVRTWTLDWMVEHYGESTVLLREAEGVSGEQVLPNEQQISFREFVADTRAGAGRYLRFGSFFDENPSLFDGVELADLHSLRGPGAFGSGYKAFIGGEGSTTRLHNAMTSNLFVQIEGRKSWRLYPASYAAALRMPASHENINYSYADPRGPDPDRFPSLQYLDAWDVTLDPGDVLYVPPWMWHQVTNLSESIGFSYRFADVTGAVRASQTMTLMRCLSRNQPVWRLLKGLLDPRDFYVHGWQRR